MGENLWGTKVSLFTRFFLCPSANNDIWFSLNVIYIIVVPHGVPLFQVKLKTDSGYT